MVSRPCDHCLKVRRCEMLIDAGGRPAYLCRRCQRELEYGARPSARAITAAALIVVALAASGCATTRIRPYSEAELRVLCSPPADLFEAVRETGGRL